MEYGNTPRIAAISHLFPTRLDPSMLQPSFLHAYPDLPIINLSPGQLLIAEQASIVSTILGSCISLCLHSEKMRIGAICHAILPRQTKLPMPGQFPFLDTAVAHMLETMASRFGLAPSELTVKLFGGASVLQADIPAAHGHAIGQQNIAAALEVLARFGLAPHVQKTGGSEGYKIFFNTATGDVFVRRIHHNIAKSLH